MHANPIESCADLAVGCDGLDDSEVPVGDSDSLIGCGELDPVADGEVLRYTAIDADPGEPALAGHPSCGYEFVEKAVLQE